MRRVGSEREVPRPAAAKLLILVFGLFLMADPSGTHAQHRLIIVLVYLSLRATATPSLRRSRNPAPPDPC